MLEKFNNAYTDILNNTLMTGRLFYESTAGSMSKIDIINISTAKEFYDVSIRIIDNVIEEAHKDVNFSNTIINKIYTARNFDKFEYFQIYQNSKECINKVPIYVFKFDFSNPKEIVNIFSSFNIKFSLENGTLKEKYDNEIEIFKSYYQECNGLFSYVGTCAFLMLNITNYTKSTIQHELYHYVQHTSNIMLDLVFDEDIDIYPLQLTNVQLRYLFNPKEFEAHIKVDLINQLEELYYKRYKNKFDKHQFCINFINAIRNNPEGAADLFAVYLSMLKNSDNTALRLFAACFIIKNKEFLNNAIKWLQDRFN